MIYLHKAPLRGEDASSSQYFFVKEQRQSESAVLYFGQMLGWDGPTVLKVLLPRQDTRVNLISSTSRQKCQVEAFSLNTYFTKDVYLALVPLLDYSFTFQDARLRVGHLITNAEEARERDDPDTTEYGLLMRALPDSQRLDCVLQSTSTNTLPRVLDRLVKRIVALHESQVSLSGAPTSTGLYGTYDRIKQKLEHNLSFLKSIIVKYPGRYDSACNFLMKELRDVINNPLYEDYLSHRWQNKHIKRCHGDLKTPNIWIEDDEEQEDYGVKVLDAIDFNESYCYIDTLSDFAMLVVDVELRTHTDRYADDMLERYLSSTNQKDSPSRMVLNYYLVEKALINGVVCILYDNQLDLGQEFLQLAERRVKILNAALLASV